MVWTDCQQKVIVAPPRSMAAGEGAHHGQTGVNNLLRGSRTRSYGSLVQSSLSPVRQTRIQHTVQPGDTLQGLALKYGVSTEEIKRANRLYTNDSIFLKKTLSIPLLSDTDAYSGQTARDDSDESPNHVPVQNGKSASSSKRMQVDGESELSPMDFLKRMDHLISVSKQAAVKGCEEGEKRFADLEAVCTSRSPDGHRLTRSQSATTISSHRMHQAALGAVPLTITKRTKNLREREDDIFEL